MKKEEDIQKVRSDYESIRQMVMAGDTSIIKLEQIKQQKKTLIAETNFAQENEHYENLDELI